MQPPVINEKHGAITLGVMIFGITTFSVTTLSVKCLFLTLAINVEGVTLVLPSRPFMFIKYWRILALS